MNRAREALQEKQEEDRLRAETEEPERSQEAPEPRPPNEDEGDSKKR